MTGRTGRPRADGRLVRVKAGISLPPASAVLAGFGRCADVFLRGEGIPGIREGMR